MIEQNENISKVGSGLVVPKKRRRWLKVVLGLIILLCGFVLGVGTTLVVSKHRIFRIMHDSDHVANEITWRLSWWLNLSDEQKITVKQILTKRHKALQKIFIKTWPQVDHQLNLVEQEVSKVLNPKQAAKWQKKFRKMRKRI